ncbi:polysaccharide biosynthesis/export family protein [Stieleria sp. TO1_6]|uniref:polysaccharide biosynthesis/export family protein n=1 Tax=Stieleria tagensis TaxID=2956795 RepID=UPI00209B7458|nr:polysaccharide biosynthesis/export family protein [Stieleria tagensis]MCO8124084.1 polysaccharide biosynthesis/export family protein [Stieleria tagensis]
MTACGGGLNGWITAHAQSPGSAALGIGVAQDGPVTNEMLGQFGSTVSETECGCRNVPGGYPCQGGCPKCMMAVDCQDQCGQEGRWRDMAPQPFDAYGPGGYAGPSRYAHLSEYRLRPNDQLQVIYLITRRQDQGDYRLAPGDEVLIESVADPDLTRGTLERGLVIQPDGTITVRLLGQIHAAGLTVSQLRQVLETSYKKLYDEPSIDVTPVRTNTLADDIRNAVGGASGLQQQALNVTVMPDGKIRLPGIGGLCVQGFSLPELKKEINLRYRELVVGLETEPILTQQANHFVNVLGQVAAPGRIQLEGPTTVLAAIAQSGGHLPGGNMRQVVVFRRAEDWRLISTMLDLQGAVYGKRPTPADEIWLRDGDVIIVPDKPIQRLDNWLALVFTNGVYRVAPFNFDGR